MYLGDPVALVGCLVIVVVGATLPRGVQPLPPPRNAAASSSSSFAISPSASATARPASARLAQSSTTCLSNMLRDFASYDDYGQGGGGLGKYGIDYRSTDWRRNQGYNLNRPTPPELGGTPWQEYYGHDDGYYYQHDQPRPRDLETNPYYDPGWAQSVRRDDTSSKSSVTGSGSSSGLDHTYPGFTNPRNTDKVYTNPTNPYYNPIWSQSVGLRSDEPIREGDHTAYYAPGYDIQNRNYYMNMNMNNNYNNNYYYNNNNNRGGGGGGYYNEYNDGYGGGGYSGSGSTWRMRGAGAGGRMGLYAYMSSRMTTNLPLLTGVLASKKSVNNCNSLMRTKKSSLLLLTKLSMSYYGGGGGWDDGDGPMFDGPPMMNYGKVMRSGDYSGATTGSGAYGRNDVPRRGGGRGRNNIRGGRGRMMGQEQMMMPPMMDGGGQFMGVDPFVNAGGGPPFYGGRENRGLRQQSLKDMASRTTQSFDAEVIRSMNNRSNTRRSALLAASSTAVEAGGQRKQTMTSTTSTSSQYVPLSSIYGPPRGGPAMVERSPPLLSRQPIIDANARSMGELPQSIHTARLVRPSVVLVTSEGVRKENSQGSGFVVAFDDSAMEDEEDDNDDEMKDRVYILTSAHVAPPGWKVSVTFASDPDKEYPAKVVGRKLNSDLALLCVETIADEDDDYPFPPPLVLTGEDVSTDTFRTNDNRVPTSEIGSPVYSFGYPMGVEGPTMTSGILSATTKGISYMDAPTGEDPSEISKSRPFEKTSFVITDAAMAGGMSGGPLVNNEGIVLGINALVRPDLRALGNYAVSALECEVFLGKLEEKRSKDAAKSINATTKRGSSRTASSDDDSTSEGSSSRRSGKMAELQTTAATDVDIGIAGFRVMLYGYSSDKPAAAKVLRRVAGLDELRAENAMRSAQNFGSGVVDEFYVAESGNRERAVKAARKSADELSAKLAEEGMMVQVEPLNLLK